MNINDVAPSFEGAKITGPNKLTCKCPLHDDRKNSLIVSVDKDKEGREWVNAHCFAHCDKEQLRTMLKEKGFNKFTNAKRRSIKDDLTGDRFITTIPHTLNTEKKEELWKKYGYENTYMYYQATENANEAKQYTNTMFITRKDLPDGGKEFSPHTLWKDKTTKEYKWLQKGPPGEWKRPPYNCLHIPQMKSCFIHEGEKAVMYCSRNFKDAMHITWSGGANAINKTDWNVLSHLAIEHFLLIPDNDDPGRKAMKEIGSILKQMGKDVRWVDTSGYPEKWDFADIKENVEPALQEKELHEFANKLNDAVPFELDEEEEKPNFIYVSTLEKFYNTEHGYLLSEKGYNRKMAQQVGHLTAHKEFFRNPLSVIVDKITFEPNKPYGVLNEGSQSLWNYYEKVSNLVPVEGDITKFLEHMEYLVPDELTRIEVIKRLAHIVQKPHIKIKSVLLMFSEAEGVGKTTIFNILREILGHRYCKQVNQRQMSGEFNTWARDTLLFAIEEIAIKGNYEKRTSAMDILKTVISEDTICINEKNDKPYYIPNHMNGLGFSNNSTPITITKLNRRYHIINCIALKKPPAYYDVLYTWLEKDQGYEKIYHYLNTYDISSFNPNAEPPKTKAFYDLVDETQTPTDIELDYLYQANSWPFTDSTCLVSPLHLKKALNKIKINASTNDITKWLKKNNYINLETQIEWLNNERPTIWTNSEPEKFRVLKPKELKDFYLEPTQDRDSFYFVDADQVKRQNAVSNLDSLMQNMP
jgi:hypothetical protein